MISTINITRIIKSEIKIRMDFISIPKILEKRTSPCLYSFFKGFTKVFKSKFRERRETVYRLKSTKFLATPPTMS